MVQSPQLPVLTPGMTDWNVWIAHYTQQMSAVNRSPGTIRLHAHYLAHLANLHPNPTKITTSDLLALMNRPSWGPDAKRSARMVWRGFFKWAHGMGLIETWPGEAIPAVTLPKRLPRPAPEFVVRRSTADPTGLVALMCLLGAHCGLRAGEIARVHPRRHLDGDILRVIGKGNKERIVPVENELLLCRLEAITDGWAFPSSHPDHDHYTPGHVSRLMSEALPDGWTAHNLRHRYATEALEGTSDLLAVAELMGHASVATTQGYTKVSAKRLRLAARAAA